ncbi:MAG: nucleotidyltransferase family protein [candidate division KSB1 bacterium]
MFVTALVLAAGTSARMQHQNKLLLEWRAKPLIAHTVDHLLQTYVAEIIVVVGYGAAQVRAALQERPLRFVMNHRYAEGLSTSIIAGLAAISDKAEAVLICLGDLPLVAAAEINLLLTRYAQAERATIAVPIFNGQRGNPVLFNRSHCAAMLNLTGDAGCKTIIRQHEHEVLEVEMASDHVLRDVDTLEAYAQLVFRTNRDY